ncbi:MAG: protein YgfX [Rudaea sp.]
MKSAPLVAFDYCPSRYLIAAVAAALVLAMIAIALCGMNVLAKLVLACIALTYAFVALRRFQRLAPTRVAWQSAGHWRLVDRGGTEKVAELSRSIVRGNWIVLNLRCSDASRVDLILGPDNSDAETRRVLRVRLSRADDGTSASR